MPVIQHPAHARSIRARFRRMIDAAFGRTPPKEEQQAPPPIVVPSARAWHECPAGWTDHAESGQWVETSGGVITFDPSAGKGRDWGLLHWNPQPVERGQLLTASAKVRENGRGKGRIKLGMYHDPVRHLGHAPGGDIEADGVKDDGISTITMAARFKHAGPVLGAYTDGVHPVEFSEIRFIA